jgi:hypothetical protein
MEWKLEVVTIPVKDVERAKRFTTPRSATTCTWSS